MGVTQKEEGPEVASGPLSQPHADEKNAFAQVLQNAAAGLSKASTYEEVQTVLAAMNEESSKVPVNGLLEALGEDEVASNVEEILEKVSHHGEGEE